MSEFLASYTALPNLHPAVVHFPIALLPLAWLLDLVSVVRRNSPFWDRSATLLYALGAAGAALAVRAGEQAADTLVGVPAVVQPDIGRHSDSAHLALYLFAALAVARIVLWWRDRQAERLTRVAFRAGLLATGIYGLITLALAADQGGALVYRHGLGVTGPAVPAAPTMPPETLDEEAGAGPVRDSRGVLTWSPRPTDLGAVGRVLSSLSGSVSEVVRGVPTSPGQRGLSLAVEGQELLLLEDTFTDAQIDAGLDLSDFTGSVGLAHHVRDLETRSHFAVDTAGTVELVDLRDGHRTSVDRASIEDARRRLDLGVSSSGSHLKGLIDNLTVAHGHLPPGGPGKVGLLLDGSGTVRLLSLTVTPLEGV